VHGERAVYESPWVNVALADVELPDGVRFEHHVVHVPGQAAAAIAHDVERGVLLIWRHRFITDRWGWELPGGRVDPGETPAEAAAREMLEESGWRAGPLRPLFAYNPLAGLSDQLFHVFVAAGAAYEREPEGFEAERVEWVPVPELRGLIRRDEVPEGFSLTALLWFLALEEPA
jgi:8-oxo-dGTP pyrophosphatase MutT (NUDIX family)